MVDAEKRLLGFDPKFILDICKEYLAGQWLTVSLNEFEYKPLT